MLTFVSLLSPVLRNFKLPGKKVFFFFIFLFLKEAFRHLLHQVLYVCFLLECLTPVHTNSGTELCPSFSVVH